MLLLITATGVEPLHIAFYSSLREGLLLLVGCVDSTLLFDLFDQRRSQLEALAARQGVGFLEQAMK